MGGETPHPARDSAFQSTAARLAESMSRIEASHTHICDAAELKAKSRERIARSAALLRRIARPAPDQ